MTDRHALAVLIYMYLLYRHPLRGGKVHDVNDPQKMKIWQWVKSIIY